MKKTKFLAVAMATAMLGSTALTACTPTTQGGEVLISVINYFGGVGRKWLDDAIERFKDLNEGTDYGGGYVGVDFEEPVNQQGISTATMDTDGYHIYFLEGGQSVNSLAQQGFLLDLTDTLTTPLTEYGESKSIEDKITANYRVMEKGNDGNYYGVPHVEFYSGISYDIDAFETYGLYLAAEGGVQYQSKFGTANFYTTGATKTVGPDGKAGSDDDGLPSSLKEFLILCSRMKNTYTMSPFGLAGKQHGYSNFLITSLWSALAGYDKMQTCYSFDGTIDVVTGYTEEPLFALVDDPETEGVDESAAYKHIKKPITTPFTVTEETGYRVYDMVERYYATAFLEIAVGEGWFSSGASTGTENTTEQYRFICSGAVIGGQEQEKIGMYVDGSYWYNESNVEEGNFDDYYDMMPPGTPKRKIGWMSLPVTLDRVVTQGNGKDSVMLEVALSNAFINGNIKDNAPYVKACTDFIRFLYSDKELQNFTACTGMAKAVNYDLGEKESELDAFQKSVWDRRNSGAKAVLYAGADNATFLGSLGSFNLYAGAEVFKYGGYKNYYDVFTKDSSGNATAQTIFNATKMTEDIWNSLYKGDEN